MADRSIKVVLRAEVTGFTSQMALAAASAGKLGTDAAKVTTGLGQMVESAQRNREAWTTAGRSLTVFGGTVVGALGLATRSAMQWESAWTGVLKTVDGTDTQLAEIEGGLRDLARTLPSTHEEIAAVAEAAGQLGVETPNVVAFTRTMIDLGQTTNLSAQDAATGLARFSNVMGTTQGDIGRLGSVLVDLGNNFATTEREILEMGQRLSSAGRIVGLSEAQVLGLASAMSSVGIEAEAGGSAISRVMIAVSKAVDDGGSDLDAFARAAGTNAESFARQWRSDPVEALLAVVAGLARMTETGGGTFAMLDELGLRDIRVTNAMLSLSNAVGLTTDAVDTASRAWKDNTALIIEAEKRYDTAESKIAIARNSLNDAAIEIGENILPALARLADGVAAVAQWFADLPDPVQSAVTGLGSVVGVSALVAGGFLLTFPRVIETYKAFHTLAAASPRLASALSGVGKAAGALGLVLAAWQGISALGAGSQSTRSVSETTKALLEMGDSLESLDERFQASSGLPWMRDYTRSVTGAMDQIINYSQTFAGRLDDLLTTSRADKARQQFGEVGEALAGLVSSGAADRAADAFDLLNAEWERLGGNGDDLLALMPAYTDALADAGNQQALTADSADALAEATQYVGMSTEEATEALEEWRQAVADADQAFIDLVTAYDDAIQANTDMAQETADATSSSKDSWEDYYDGVSVSAADYISQLQAQVDAQAAWEQNILDITERVKTGMTGDMADAANAMIDELLTLGPEGAAQVQLLHDMTDEEFAQVVDLWSQKGTDAVTEFVSQVEAYRQPVITLTADTSQVYAAVDRVIRDNDGRVITLDTLGRTVSVSSGRGSPVARAHGGILPGMPSSRDNMVIAAASGEYVVNARATQRHRPLLEAINSGAVPGYQSGGFVAPLRPSPVYMYAPTVASVPARPSGPLVSVGQIVATDPRVAMVETEAAVRLAMVGVPR